MHPSTHSKLAGQAPGRSVCFHPTAYPGQVARDLAASLRTRRVNHKFHYDSYKQTRRWLQIHQVFSPSRVDPDCVDTYDTAFNAALRSIGARFVEVVGLGCGGGQKDRRALERLQADGHAVGYAPVDVSAPMVLVASEAVGLDPAAVHPLVCDLAQTGDLAAALPPLAESSSARVVTFFGMIPNFEPGQVLPAIGGLLGKGDRLLISANLAPGLDYRAGVEQVQHQYDNELTRRWLLTFLTDLGLEEEDGQLEWNIEPDESGNGLLRWAAWFRFTRPCALGLDQETFHYRPGESMRLFFSYRYTPAGLGEMLHRCGLAIDQSWVTPSGEEGVFLVHPA